MKTGENSYTLLGTSHELEFFFFLSFKKGSSTSCLYLANLKGKLKWKKSDVHRWITDISLYSWWHIKIVDYSFQKGADKAIHIPY